MYGASPPVPRGLSGRTALGLIYLATLAGPSVQAQDPPSGPDPAIRLTEPERARLLADRDRLGTEVLRLSREGKPDAAVTPLREWIAATRRAKGNLHEEVVVGLNMLTLLLETRGDWPGASAAMQEVVSIRQRQPGRIGWRVDDARRAVAYLDRRAAMTPNANRRLFEAEELTRVATAQHARGDFAAALKSTGSALEIRRDLLGEADPTYGLSLANLGTLYQAMGEHARAEPLLRRATEIRLKALGEAHPEYAASLANLGVLYQAMGDHARAEPWLRRATEIYKQALGEDDRDYAISLGNLGTLYQAMGDFARAEPLLRRATEVLKQALGEADPDYATSLNNLGTLYMAMGDFARAAPLFLRSIDIRKKASGEAHPEYATSLANLGTLCMAIGDHARAVLISRRAMEAYKQALGEAHPAYAASLNHLGTLYMLIGDNANAEPLLRRATEIRLKALGEAHPQYATSLANLGTLYQAMGDFARAEPTLRRAIEIVDAFTRGTGAVLGERQRLRLIATHRGTLNGYLSVVTADGAGPGDPYRLVLNSKGAADIDQAERRLAFDRPELRGPQEKLERVRTRLARLAFAIPPPAGMAAWRKELDALREAKEGLEADLAARSAAYGRLRQARYLGPDGLAAALPEDTALVDLLEYTHSTPPEGGKGHFRFERRLLAFVTRRGHVAALVPLGPAGPVDAAVDAWRTALQGRRPDDLRSAAAELARLAWVPLRPHLGGAQTVLIAPDGALAYFPFAALPGERPGSYLIEDLAIGYVASGRHAAEALGERDGPPGRGLLAVGAVDFAADPGPAGPSDATPAPAPLLVQRGGFRSLPATGPEARRARELFRTAFADEGADLLTAAEPTEGELKRRLHRGRLRAVHLGTHGFFESPARLAALRKADRAGGLPNLLSGAGGDESAYALTPLLRSGLILAGGGRDPGPAADPLAAGPGLEDGILTAEEVQALDLRGCELVVLSACDTGLGQLERGQGVLGLQRSFHAAGARAVVASLWKVDDAATGLLMERFYAHLWSERLPKLEALRRAQLAVLNDPGLVDRYRVRSGLDPVPADLAGGGKVVPPPGPGARSDPSLWAAFVLSGDVR